MKSDDAETLYDIDQYALDREWIRQPVLYQKAAEKLSIARADLEAAKSKKELVTAELDYLIRSNPTNFGLDKITEAVISQTVIRQSKYQDVAQDYLDCKHAVDIWQVKVDTLDHRKKALENLVSLRLADYFSTPRAPKEGVDYRPKKKVPHE